MANYTGTLTGQLNNTMVTFSLPAITDVKVLRYGPITKIESLTTQNASFVTFNLILRTKNSAGVINTVKTISASKADTSIIFLGEDIAPYLNNQYPYFELEMDGVYTLASSGPKINNLGYTYKTPIVSNVQLSTRYADIVSNLTFAVDYFDSAVIKIKNDSTVLLEQTVTAKSLSVPVNTFVAGVNTVEITAKNVDVDSNTLITSYTMDSSKPSILSLEPNEVNQNVNTAIIASWASTFQTTFKLTIGSTIYTGTTAKTLTIPANTLTSGTKTMTLEITYIPSWATSTADYRTATKTVNFLAYGNPPKPTLLNKSIISSATPLIKWDSTEQTHYELKLLEGMSNVEVTGEVLSTAKQYQVTTALENNKLYNLKLRVKNQYGLWSEYATSTFTTSFIVPNAPTISGFANVTNGSIVLNVETVTSAEYKNSEIWRKEPYGEWVRMAYNLALLDAWEDRYVRSDVEYEYKARSIGQTGGIAESDAIKLSVAVNGYNFYNLEKLNSNITFKYEAEVIPTYNRNEALTVYAGCKAPSYETDNVIYRTLNMSFVTKELDDIDKLISLIKTTKVFLYKDKKGNKVFGMITGNFSPKTDNSNITNIAFTFTELSFLEQDVYAGDNTGLKLIIWDGTWMFDGTYIYGGA